MEIPFKNVYLILWIPLELQTKMSLAGFGKTQGPRLQQLAQQLFGTVMSSKAPSTEKKYLYAFGRWKSWAKDMNGVTVFPVEAIHLALYLQHLGNSNGLRASVEEAVYALSWIHEATGLPYLINDPFVQTVLGGLRRMLVSPTVKKQPISY